MISQQTVNNLSVNDQYRINFGFKLAGLNNSLMDDSSDGLLIQKTVLIFGKTGAGKSSILNSITNRSSDIFKEGDSAVSQTGEVHAVVHKLFNHGMNCLFIDSPGLFDSGNRDKENIFKISKFVQKSGFSIILFAHSILETRIDNTFHKTLEMLTEIFGKTVMDRVYFVFTHLNSLNENKKKDKINSIENEFNGIVQSNKNELLFFDYENLNNDNYGLKKLEEILKSYTTLLIPFPNEESIFYDILETKQKSLKMEEKLILDEFKLENDKSNIFFNNKQIEVTKKENEFNNELLEFKNKIEKSIQDYRIAKQQAVNNYQMQKNNEFYSYQTERINYKASKQTEFINLGGSYVGDNYTIGSTNQQQLMNLFNIINGIPAQIKAKSDSINSEVQNYLNTINQEIQRYNSQSQINYENKKAELNNKLQFFLKERQKEIDLEKEKLLKKESDANIKLKTIGTSLSEVNTDMNYFQFKKNNSNFSITITGAEGKNYCVLNNIIKKDTLQKMEFTEFKEKSLSLLKENQNFSFDVEYSKNYFTFDETKKKVFFKSSSNVKLGETDYHLFPVARINFLIKKKIILKLFMNGYGWFGIGNANLSSDGFPGYNENGWMICTDGRIFHNKSLIYNFGINSQSKETYLECDVENKLLSLFCNGNYNKVSINNMPNELYFVVSFSTGTSVNLDYLYFNQ
jgi:hypothetical protein